MELGRFFGFLHPAFVHFPLVLLLVSVTLEAVGFFRRDPRFTFSAQVTLLVGTVAMLFAFVCGNFAEIWAARDGISQDPMEYHELLATVTSWLFVFLTAGRLLLGKAPRRSLMAVYLVAALVGCVLLGVTGHVGAKLVYDRGAGVQIDAAHGSPTHEDLAVLRQKQDPDALFYSNKMHHVFGGMVMILSLMLLIDMVSPKTGEKLRKVGPLLLLAGGIFLMIYSDTDSWPLSHQRPITDKEVLMHKTYALLMLLFGIGGLWPRKGGAKPTRQLQARAMAVFSLIGGALLFTHVHSNAPYANVAVGVYLHHTVMGFIALSIGAVKLMEDSIPGGQEEAPQRKRRMALLKWAYPCLMCVEAIMLLNYNEGLPWFLGYRDLRLEAPHQGLIAPLGRERAELVYDPATTRFDLYLLGQADDRPRSAPSDTAAIVVRVGTEATVVPMTNAEGTRPHSHFTGTASFLHGVPMFQAQALVTDPTAGASRRVADFEPWTDANLTTAQHSQAAYVCPHHPAVGSGTPGQCAVCGMALVPNKTARSWNQLHDDAYKMDLTLAAHQTGGQRTQVASLKPIQIAQASAEVLTPIAQPQPGQTIRLTLTPRHADGTPVTALEVVHTKKLHLIVTSKDLSFFDHIHPEPQPDGSLALDYAFPAPGDYLLYADLTPVGDRNQVFRLPVTVAGTPRPAVPLTATEAGAKVFGEYRVALRISPTPAVARDEAQLSFTISQNGVPVTDLEPFLGAGGHCVVVSEDTQGYLHSHPLEMNGDRFGPTVTFHTLFPRPGLYKIWGQFLHQGRPLTADFVVHVEKN